jgi:phytoene dehydrogenase-like protein
MKTRRDFIREFSLATGAMLFPSAQSCSQKNKIIGAISGPNLARGHKVRDMQRQRPKQTIKQDVVIIGGGVSGLSAGRWLHKNNQSFILLELEDEAGGNSRAGRNTVSPYPLGAHYLPLPSLDNKELIDFLKECNVITGFHDRLPICNEYYLCHDPKERLYINHHWQEGLIPHEGIPVGDRDQIQRFLNLMEAFRQRRGTDGKPAFNIPIDKSSRDAALLKLDTISMAAYLSNNNFTSSYLHWYIDYCCADDYGATMHDTSAWAGIHYFASRKGEAANAKMDDVLTWPEGNYWLVRELKKDIEKNIKPKSVVLSVQCLNRLVAVDYFDEQVDGVIRLEADSVIMATPQFINKHLIRDERSFQFDTFQYAPWMVANLTISSALDEKRGEPLCWDNVIYGSQSLGYVHAAHQNLALPKSDSVISYYRPITETDCAAARKQSQSTSWENWKDSILNDLKPAHPNLTEHTQRLDVWIWGHGMIRPSPGFIWGPDRSMAKRPLHNKIFFAHSDLSGVSIFEEAFNNGIEAAKSVLNQPT